MTHLPYYAIAIASNVTMNRFVKKPGNSGLEFTIMAACEV
tara:strand:+ start:233 stop:352 length:120 start_codon:yes stop_codon:yes gene_type:complete